MSLASPSPMGRSSQSPSIEFAHDAAEHDGTSGATDFVRNLFRVLDEKLYPSLIAWTAAGDAFIVKDVNEFSKTALPRMFKHSNFASFVRQLNKYSFHKIKHFAPEDPTGDHAWVFRHPDFRAGNLAGLERVRRKPQSSSPTARRGGSPPGADDVAALARSTEELRGALAALEGRHAALQSEVGGLQRTLAQQDACMLELLTRGTSLPASGSGSARSSPTDSIRPLPPSPVIHPFGKYQDGGPWAGLFSPQAVVDALDAFPLADVMPQQAAGIRDPNASTPGFFFGPGNNDPA